jgi:hypothetical protein
MASGSGGERRRFRNDDVTVESKAVGMNRRSLGIVAVLALVVASLVVGVVQAVGAGETIRWSDVPWALQPVFFAIAGGAIMWRRPGNIVGRLLLLPALAWTLDPFVTWKLQTVDPLTVHLTPTVYLALLIDTFSWLVLVFPVFHLLLVFPTGRLLSRNWRWAVILEVAMIGLLVVLGLASERIGPIPENGRGDWTVEVPFGFVSDAVFESPWFGIGWPLGLVSLSLAGVTALGVRYRRAAAVERHQIKWLLAAAGLFASVYVAAGALEETPNLVIDSLLGLALGLIPMAVMVAVLRYRLFEIDRLISRTLTYALAAGFVAAVYAGTVVGLTAILPVAGSDLAVAGSTLVAFAAFRPARRAAQAWIDRRFDRTHYDAARMVDEMADRLRHGLDLAGVTSALTGFANESLQPSHVSVWLRQSGDHRGQTIRR